MAAKLDERIEVVRERFGLSRDDFWELPQKKGTYVAKHAALEVAAVKANIAFNMPQILEANAAEGVCAVCVQGSMEGRVEWSIGEASPKNNKNAYPWAMAEKRAKDRVILKLIGIHGLVYSEEEADDFKSEPAPPQRAASNLRQQFEDSIELETKMLVKDQRVLWAEMRDELNACQSIEQLSILWNSKVFKDEYRKLKPDWQGKLVEHKDSLKAEFAEASEADFVPPDFDRIADSIPFGDGNSD